MTRAISWLLSAGLVCLAALAQPKAEEPVKTTLCDLTKHPETYDGKLVQLRALVDSGVQDLPSGLSDDSCGAELRFFTPDDEHFLKLAKSKAFQKLIKDVKRNPAVEATVTGFFKQAVPGQGPTQKPELGLALESVEDIVVHPQPRVKRQNR